MVALGAGHLEQILDNLIDNAIDALAGQGADGAGGSIRISADRDGYRIAADRGR